MSTEKNKRNLRKKQKDKMLLSLSNELENQGHLLGLEGWHVVSKMIELLIERMQQTIMTKKINASYKAYTVQNVLL